MPECAAWRGLLAFLLWTSTGVLAACASAHPASDLDLGVDAETTRDASLSRDAGLADDGDGLRDAAVDPTPLVSPSWAPVSPLPAWHVGLSPTLRVRALAPSAAPTQIDVCADRACASVVRSFDAVSDAVTVEPPLEAGLYYWHPVGGAVPCAMWSFHASSESSPLRPPPYVDVNGDGFADIVTEVSGPVTFAGSAGGPVELPPPGYGYTLDYHLEGIGDFDGDGYGDVLTSTFGMHWVLDGSASGPSAWGRENIPGADGTDVVAGVGDLDDDGYADVAWGSLTTCRVDVTHGVLWGSSTSTADAYREYSPGPCPVAGPLWFDANGNGSTDFALGFADADRVDVVDGHDLFGATAASWSGATGSGFGTRVVGVGDVDGDGFGDVAVLQLSPPAVVVQVSSGAPRTIAVTPTMGALPNVTPVGDIDLDGYDDFAIGDATAHVVYGGATSCDAVDLGGTLVFVSVPVSGPGDIDGDGAPDLVVGAPDYATSAMLGGMLYYRGGSRPLGIPTRLVGAGGNSFGAVVATH